jgi:hypothetical protein
VQTTLLSKWAARKPYWSLVSIWAICIIIYIAAIPLPRKVPGLLFSSDGIGYFMYTRSLIIDGDLDFRNEYARLRPQVIPDITSTGLASNQYAIGPGLMWSPFFVAAHGLTFGLRATGFSVESDGYGFPYQVAVCLGSMVYGLLGIILTYHVILRYYGSVALAATILIWLGTNVIYYMMVEPSMAHMVSFFAVAFFFSLWIRWRPLPTLRQWIYLGFAGGLVAIVRQPDATFLLLPLLDSLIAPGSRFSRRVCFGWAGFAGAFVLVFSLQMYAWFALYGHPLLSGYFHTGKVAFSWLSPKIFHMLFSLSRGIYPLHPITIPATIGLGLLFRADRRLAALFFLGFAMQVYLISAWGTQGDSFGGRMFISSVPVLGLGLAAFLEWMTRTRAVALAWVGGLTLILWNGLFMVQYRFGYIPMGETPYTIGQLTSGKGELIKDVFRRIITWAGI